MTPYEAGVITILVIISVLFVALVGIAIWAFVLWRKSK
jgi:hypothetical protein